jgi:glutamate synthase (NADPH/NADH) small chain
MADPKGFLKVPRVESGYRPVEERIQDYSEVEQRLPDDQRRAQASRCMDCGVPFCHWGCPVGSKIPEWQNKLYQGDWKAAYEILEETNTFPEFTGRVCPAPCESSCVLSINDAPVTIRQNELAVIEHAFEQGWIKPRPPRTRTSQRVAVVGGGPAGLAAADILNKCGHSVVIFEAADSIGGYLRFGIPDFKLDKSFIDRRMEILLQEGIAIQTSTRVGVDISVEKLRKAFDAICLTIGAREARDLSIEGRELKGIHQAVDYLFMQNRLVRRDKVPPEELIAALDKNVVVIGGGDTGADCVGTANRQGAKCVTQLEILPKPPDHRTEETQPWPLWPRLYKTSSSHEEGCERMFAVSTRRFIGDDDGNVKQLELVKVEWNKDENGRYQMAEVPKSEFTISADLVILAMGFVHPEHDGPVAELGVELDGRGSIAVDENYMTNVEGVFAAGDAKRGASLVVYALQEGREAARGIDAYLKKNHF